jgi:Ras-related protein Rab-11A
MKESDEEYDMIFKIVIIGDSSVGKSNIMSRYLKNEFSLDSKATVGVEFGAKKLELEEYSIKAQIWDTAGQERYKSIANVYYKGAKGAFVVYDITRMESFVNVDKWINELQNNGGRDILIILIGNKCDLEQNRQVPKELGVEKAMNLGKFFINKGCAFFETSALSAVNIDKAFDHISKEIFKQMKNQIDKDDDNFPVTLGQGALVKEEKKKNECC